MEINSAPFVLGGGVDTTWTGRRHEEITEIIAGVYEKNQKRIIQPAQKARCNSFTALYIVKISILITNIEVSSQNNIIKR